MNILHIDGNTTFCPSPSFTRSLKNIIERFFTINNPTWIYCREHEVTGSISNYQNCPSLCQTAQTQKKKQRLYLSFNIPLVIKGIFVIEQIIMGTKEKKKHDDFL